MAIELFGFSIGRVDKDEKRKKSFALPEPEDGALEAGPTGSAYGTHVDFEGIAKNEKDMKDIPQKVKDEVEFFFPETVEEVFALALE